MYGWHSQLVDLGSLQDKQHKVGAVDFLLSHSVWTYSNHMITLFRLSSHLDTYTIPLGLS